MVGSLPATAVDPRPWLDRVRLAAPRVARHRSGAGHAAHAVGAGLDLHGHRRYEPGDELRHLDWHALARLGELVVREYRSEAAPTVALLVDTSASMRIGDPAKLAVAGRLATALAYLALREHGRVLVGRFSERGEWLTPPLRGLARAAEVHRCLCRLSAGGRTDLPSSWRGLSAGLSRADLVIVLSDFLIETLDAASFAGLAPAGGLVLLRVLDRRELEPSREEAELVDVESTTAVTLRVDTATAAAYPLAFRRHAAGLEELARLRGFRLATTFGDEPPGSWLSTWLAAGVVAPRTV